MRGWLCFLFVFPVLVWGQEIPWAQIRDSGVRLALRVHADSVAWSSTNLQFEGFDIVDVRFFTNFIHVQRFSLFNNMIVDVGPLGRLTNLVHLNLARNRVSNLEVLSNLVRLEVLVLHDNPGVTNLRGVHRIMSLRELDLRNTRVHHNNLRTWAFTNVLGIYDREGRYHEIDPSEKDRWGIFNSVVVRAWF